MRAERYEFGAETAEVATTEIVFFFGEHDDGAAFGGFVGEGGELGNVGQAFGADVGGGEKFRGLAIAEGDGAGLVEEKGVDVACSFDGAAGHSENVVLDEAIHACDADGGEEGADGGGDEADEKGDEDEDGLRCVRVDSVGLQRGDGEQEDDGEAGEQDAEGDFVGSLLALGAFDESDHAVEEGFAGVGGDADLDPVREDAGATGDSGAIAAGFADDGRGFAGDGRLVDGGDAFDDFAVAGDELAGFNLDDVVAAQGRAGDGFEGAVGAKTVRHGFALGLTQGIGLGFASAFSDGLGEIGEEHCEPKPQGDLKIEANGLVANGFVDKQSRGDDAANFDDKHHRIFHHQAWIEFGEGVDDRLAKYVGIPEALLFSHKCFS